MKYKQLWTQFTSGGVSAGHVKPIVSSRLILPLFAILYLITIIYTSCHHEVWRDEVRALSLVIKSHSIKNIFVSLHTEGHPSLWYLILSGGYSIINNYIVLKIASISIAFLCICLFISASPFTLIQKILFIFGYFPIYEYSVISRNYGLSMLLLFCFCILYPLRFKRFILLSVILFLLSQTNVHSLIIVISIYISLLLEIIFKRNTIANEVANKYYVLIGLVLMMAGIVSSIIEIYPDPHSVITHKFPSANIVLKSFLLSAIFPGLSMLFAPMTSLVVNIKLIINILMIVAIWLMYFLFARKPFILIIFFLSIVGLGMFADIMHPFAIRHKGFLLLLVIMAFWLDDMEIYGIKAYQTKLNKFIAILAKHKQIFITLLLITQVFIGFYAVIIETYTDYSSSKKAAMFINSDPQLKEAIIIGEPDYLMESLPYYINNPIYIPREHRFGKTVSWTENNKRNYTLNELLNTAVKLKYDLKQPILIFIGHKLTLEGPYEINFSYGKKFYYDRESLERLNKQAIKINSFQKAMTDENYDVYLLK